MVRPPRSSETLEAQKYLDEANSKLGSVSMPPDEFESMEEVTRTGIDTPIGLHKYAITFRNEWARLLFLALFLAFLAYLLGSGIIHIGIATQK